MTTPGPPISLPARAKRPAASASPQPCARIYAAAYGREITAEELRGNRAFLADVDRSLTQADTCTTTLITDRFKESGGSFKELMLAIVQSESFRRNANPEMTP